MTNGIGNAKGWSLGIGHWTFKKKLASEKTSVARDTSRQM
jgi:hypothetical protein